MKLLYLSLSYLAGIVVGQHLWQGGWFGCGVNDGYWIAMLALIPVCLWLDVMYVPRAAAPLRWPTAAGFVAPRPSLSGWLTGAVLLAGLCGILRLASHPPLPCLSPSDLAYYNADDGNRAAPRQVKVDGYVAGYPLKKEGRQSLDIETTTLWLDDRPISVAGRVRVRTDSRHSFRYGESVQMTGQLTEPPVFEGFDYRAYLARKRIHSLMWRPRVEPQPGPPRGGSLLQFVYGLRARGEALLNRLLPEPYAALANGMLLGIEAGIPDDLYEKFNLTGTSHVIVISGSNVALVSGALMAIGIKLFGRRYALLPTLAGLAIYTILVGGDAAVMRAALMGGLFVLATVLNRQSTALVSLAAACWAMTLWNPLTLWDVGFQLSSAATAGLILCGPVLTERATAMWSSAAGWFRRGSAPETGTRQPDFLMPSSITDLIRDSLLMTIAASATTLPLIVYYFDRLSWISPITNLLIAPVQPLIMIGGGIGMIVGLFAPGLIPQILLSIPYAGLWWTVEMVRWHAALPGGSVEVSWFRGEHAAFAYTALCILYWRRPLTRGVRAVFRFSDAARGDTIGGRLPIQRVGSIPAWTFGIMAVAAALLWTFALTQPDGQLHIHFLDIGQGDGIFIQTPSGRQLLIDGGDDSRQLFAELGAVMPFWDRRIDWAVVTHPDWDHIGAQTELSERYRIDRALISENTRDHEDTQEWLNALAAEQVPVAGLRQGGWLDLGDGVALWALWPPPEEALRGFDEEDKNERSLVLKLVYGELAVLLTGDIGQPSEERLLRAGQPVGAQVLKVGHHGSEHSSSPAFIAAVGPSVAVIQVGAENRYGHPDPDVMEILRGRLALRNDKDGRIHIRSDGRQMWIATENGALPALLARSDVAHTR